MYTHVEADPRVEPPTKLELLLARAWLLRKTIGGVALDRSGDRLVVGHERLLCFQA